MIDFAKRHARVFSHSWERKSDLKLRGGLFHSGTVGSRILKVLQDPKPLLYMPWIVLKTVNMTEFYSNGYIMLYDIITSKIGNLARWPWSNHMSPLKAEIFLWLLCRSGSKTFETKEGFDIPLLGWKWRRPCGKDLRVNYINSLRAKNSESQYRNW